LADLDGGVAPGAGKGGLGGGWEEEPGGSDGREGGSAGGVRFAIDVDGGVALGGPTVGEARLDGDDSGVFVVS
jgi:hypothetical protein